MFRLMDEINFFFEIWCLRVMFHRSSAAPSCGQKWESRRYKSTLFEGTKGFRRAVRLQTRTAHRPEAAQISSEEHTNALDRGSGTEHLTA